MSSAGIEARPLSGSRAGVAPLGLSLPSPVGGAAIESRLADAFVRELPATAGQLVVDLGQGADAGVRERLWDSPSDRSVPGPVILTHGAEPRSGSPTGARPHVSLRAYPWRTVQAVGGPPPTGPGELWGVELPERELTAEVEAEVAERRPGFVLLPVHLLNAGAAATAVSRLSRDGVPVIGADPFAGGRLDGSFLGGSALERGPRSRPVDAQELSRTFAPVLALGFLTADGKRTLPEAAIEFAGNLPGVVTTLAPFRTPAEFRRAVGVWGAHSLTAEERSRLSEPRELAGGSNTPGS